MSTDQYPFSPRHGCPFLIGYSLICAFLVILPLSSLAQIGATVDPPFINLTEYSLFYVDESNTLTPEEAEEKLSAFKKSKKANYNFGLTSASLWVCIDLTELDLSLDQLLVLEPRLEEVAVYVKEDGNWREIYLAGQSYPFEKRKIATSSYLIGLSGKIRPERKIFLRIQNETKRNIPIFLSDEQGVLIYYNRRNLVNGLYFGLLFVMILYNSFVFLSVRDKNYLFYIIFLILIAFTQGHMMGLAQQYLFPHNSYLMIYGAPIFAPLAGIAAIVFMMNILNTRHDMAFNHKLLIAAIAVYALAILSSFMHMAAPAYIFMQAGNLMGSLVVLICAISSVMRGNITARYILVGWAIIIFCIISYVLTELGVLEFRYSLSPHLVEIGSGFEILLFSFALADRINRYREENLQDISEKERLLRLRIESDKENSRKQAELELSALRAQMNPHFVFNALGAIQYYIHTRDVELADDYLTKFALLIRKYLESSREKMISIREEMELLKLYTDLEILRFESKFKCSITNDDELDIEEDMMPSMLIQPFIENAIKHGLNERSDGLGHLKIHFSCLENGVSVYIEDNGIGFEKGLSNRSPSHQSRGMQIIKEKANTLEESGLAKVKIAYDTLDPDHKEYPGTVVRITIKSLKDYE